MRPAVGERPINEVVGSGMAADPPDTDPVDRDPRERGLERRSNAPVASPWLVIGCILLLGAVIYAVSALLL